MGRLDRMPPSKTLIRLQIISDNQQFFQYQQNKQLPLTLNHLTQKRVQHIPIEIQAQK
jgi:hypothetical protein